MSASGVRDRVATPELLRTLRSLEQVSVAFAARVDARKATFVLDQFDGARTTKLRNLTSPLDRGLGGKCIALGRPVFVTDYTEARGISHEFDRQVAGEGLRSILAIPVVGSAGVREIVYGAARSSVSFGERLIKRAIDIVDRTAKVTCDARQPQSAPIGTTLHEIHAELVAIADEVADPELCRRLREINDRLTRIPDNGVHDSSVKLTRRELEVLSEVAMGWGNGRVGKRLGLTEQTVKSYLKSAMAKLDSHTRGEAVYRARITGLLP